jgi:hypothetical protein
MWTLRGSLFAVTFVAGFLAVASTTSANGPASKLSLMPPEDASDDARRRAALLSVHVFVEKERRDGPIAAQLQDVAPMPIVDAAGVIAKIPGARGDLYRRRAMLRLLGWVKDKPRVRDAVAILAGSAAAAKEIYRRIEAAEHGSGCQPSNPQVIANDAANAVLQKVRYHECEQIDLMETSVVPTNQKIGVTTVVTAKGSLDAARAGLDAQRWDTCNSSLWGKAYIVKVKSNGDVEEGADGMPVEGIAVTPYGDPYDTAVLGRPFFEHFTCDDDACDVPLLLHVVATRGALSTSTTTAGRSLAYSLNYDHPQQWKAFPFPSEDRGSIDVEASDYPGGGIKLSVEGNKVFAFKDSATTFAIYFTLRRIEMADDLAELVCCDKP